MLITPRTSQRVPSAPPQSALRLVPVIHLETGDIVAQLLESEREPGDQVRFGALADQGPGDCPLNKFRSLIEDAAARARLLESWSRPLHVSVPLSVLDHPDLASACVAAASRSQLCPQELCLDIPDGAFLDRHRDGFGVVRELRAVGLRVGIDATRSWDAPLTPGLKMLLDSVSVQFHLFERSPALQKAVSDASSSGMVVMAHGAKWRDSQWLAGAGITLAIRPGTDS